MKMNVAVDHFDRKGFDAFRLFTAMTGAKIELMRVQRADDFAIAYQAFRQRALPVRTTILHSEDAPIALAKHGDLLAANDVRSALPGRNLLNTAEVDHFLFKEWRLVHKLNCVDFVKANWKAIPVP